MAGRCRAVAEGAGKGRTAAAVLPAPANHKHQEDCMIPPLDRERIERAARIYSSNRDAGQALGIAPGSFGRLCRRYGLETPQARRLREHREQQERRAQQGVTR